MSSVATSEKPSKRTASKQARRWQLIQATIRSIANHGLADTTVATVSKEAGLSQGIVNLHFQSKERLLVETLRFVADEYKDTWERALANAGQASCSSSPADSGDSLSKGLSGRAGLADPSAAMGSTPISPAKADAKGSKMAFCTATVGPSGGAA